MIPLQKWLVASFTTLIDAKPTTNGRWIAIHDRMTLLLHYFDYGKDIQVDKDQLLKAIKHIDSGKDRLNQLATQHRLTLDEVADLEEEYLNFDIPRNITVQMKDAE
jgi:hypothetical protein